MRISKNNIDEYTNDKENLIGKKIRIAYGCPPSIFWKQRSA